MGRANRCATCDATLQCEAASELPECLIVTDFIKALDEALRSTPYAEERERVRARGSRAEMLFDGMVVVLWAKTRVLCTDRAFAAARPERYKDEPW